MKNRFFAVGFLVMFILTCMTFLPIEATAQQKKLPANGKEMNAIFKQLMIDCRASAPNPRSWDSIRIDKPANHYIEIKAEPLAHGKTTYLISGIKPPFIGARAPMHWIYEKTASGYRQVVDLGVCDQVTVLKSTHNGYRDIESMSTIEGGSKMMQCHWIFNGSKYINEGCRELLF